MALGRRAGLGGLGLLGSAYAPDKLASFACLCVSAAGIWGGLGSS